MNLNILKESKILQGGMGVAVSGWELARTVSMHGQTGIISGTGIAIVVSRRLQNGDKDGTIRHALNHFPIPEMAEMIWKRYFVEGGKKPEKPFKAIPVPHHEPGHAAQALLIVSNFVEVWLAKRGHDGIIGVNYLEKLQAPHLYSLFGVILAGADFVIAGAGLPTQFPEVLERLSGFDQAYYDLSVVNGPGFKMKFDPSTIMPKSDFVNLNATKPGCIGIVATAAAANILHKKSGGRFTGFVVEGPKAGGHNAPPRKNTLLNERGEPVYDMKGKDNPGLEEIHDLGLPFWLAGEHCSPEALQNALDLGAKGVQVGTAFSLSRESGITPEIKRQSIREIQSGSYDVFTDPRASPSGMPFKVVQRSGTASEKATYEGRGRICDLSYLRHPYWDEEGKLGWRCPSEPVDDYIRKGGSKADTVGRKCVCNGLMATIGLGQTQKDGSTEPPLITSGDNVAFLKHLELGKDGLYSAEQVINYLLSKKSAV